MMFTTLTLLASIASIASALPADLAERAPLATVYTKCTTPNTVALTFDDGPYEWNTLIVDTLNAAGAKGTFFVNGNNYECIYSSANVQRLKHAFSSGHQIASHTWDHADLTTLSSSAIKTELTKVDTALEKILGVKPAFLRPPYGNYNNLARQVTLANGQNMVTWDFDSGDSVGASVSQSETLYKNVANKHPSTLLALNHETESGTAHTLLPYALKTLKAKGYKFVTVAQCLGKSPYLSQTGAKAKDSTWHC